MDTLELSQALMREVTVTPEDAGCQAIIAELLEKNGFEVTHYPFGEVKNLWARHGTTAPLFVFAGHTDVVPPGPIDAWQSPPFEPTLRDGKLYGRGAADMKTGLAAMICAALRFIKENPNHAGSIGFLITSDEEGPALDGTQRVLEPLTAQGTQIDFSIVGESTCDKQFGDTIKNGRRGSLSATLTIEGKQSHIAYPDRAINPIHRALLPLQAIAAIEWDQGDDYFPPTTLQFSNIHSGTGAGNVIPGHLEAQFNCRYSPLQTAKNIQDRVETILKDHGLKYTLAWSHGAEPFITQPGTLTNALTQAIKKTTGITPALSTIGGTSDARFIAKTGAQAVEFGVCNETAHQIDEHTSVAELNALTDVYQRTLEALLR